uniref:C2H2-type domain-containing protein n=1 Tax=Electrophorus electricus TaxID=8005 RepID=A0AAY5ECT6_ELEEL
MPEAYLEHRREHTHDGPIVCLDTDSQWDDLLVSTDGGRRTLCCALCGRKFSSSRGFFTHQLKHRNQVIKRESVSDTGQSTVKQKVFECRDCGKMFASIGQCLNHQRSHKQASKSVFHQLAHLKKKSFQCPTCGRCYSRASALDAHRRCHEIKLVKSRGCETEKPHSVNEAPVKIEDTTDTTSAQLGGPQEKLFECLCGKAFRTLCGLGTHQRFSTNCSNVKVKMEVKRSFECTECGKTFVSSVALSCHQRWHKRRAQLDPGRKRGML